MLDRLPLLPRSGALDIRHAASRGLAWYRAACARGVPSGRHPWLGTLGAAVAAVLLLAFAGFLALILSHRIYLGNDSAQSYGHVWFLARSLFSGEGIPLTVPYLDGGRAPTFPYAAIPWLPTALLWPLLGDWAVTASMVLGAGLLILGLTRWLPRTASPLVMAAVLVNWQLWNSILQFQLPTVWAFAFVCFSAAYFDRDRPRLGAACAAVALIAHPLMGALGLVLVAIARTEQARRLPLRRVPWLIGAILVASPAIWMFAATPAAGTAAAWNWKMSAHILVQRSSLLWWPWLCQRLFPITARAHTPLLLIGATLMVFMVRDSNPQNLRWQSLPRFPDYVLARTAEPDARYRVLTMSNQEDGMVQLMQSGAILTQSFFDESIRRHSFPSAEAYHCFLASKGANHVLVNSEWVKRGKTNELLLLDTLVAQGDAVLAFQGSAGTRDYAIQPVSHTCPGLPPVRSVALAPREQD